MKLLLWRHNSEGLIIINFVEHWRTLVSYADILFPRYQAYGKIIHRNSKYQCLYGNTMTNNFLNNLNSEKFNYRW